MDDKITIVGPEPEQPGPDNTPRRVNIEALLLMAKYDKSFHKKLLADRGRALRESGIPFTQGELLLLQNVSSVQLQQSINSFNPPRVSGKSLPDWKKAASVILLASSLLISGCPGLIPLTGIEPGPIDSDNDGLVDMVETNTGIYVDENDTGTDPGNPDTDGDTYNDGLEVENGTDPNDPQSHP